MKEISYFLNVMTDNTLIIIDELCRSTCLEEGTAIAIAVCEKLMQTKAYTFITTHYVPLAKISQMYYNIKAWQLQSIEKTKPNGLSYLEFTYNVIPGIVSLETYALHLARILWPDIVMKYVENALEKLNKMKKVTSKFENYDLQKLLKYNFESELRILKSKDQLCLQVIIDKLSEYQENLKNLGYDLTVQNILQYHESSFAENSLKSPTDSEQGIQSCQFTESHDDVGIAENSIYIEPEAIYSQSSGNEFYVSITPENIIESNRTFSPSQPRIHFNLLGSQNEYENPFRMPNNSGISNGNVLPCYTGKFTDFSSTLNSHKSQSCSFKPMDQSMFKMPEYRPRKISKKETENYFGIPSQLYDNNNAIMNRFQIPLFTNLDKRTESSDEQNIDLEMDSNNNICENLVNTSISVSERQFSEPLLKNFSKTSTPVNKKIYSEPILRKNKIGYKSDVLINNGDVKNNKQSDIEYTTNKQISDEQQPDQPDNNKITQAIKEEVDSISEYFTQTQDWNFEEEVTAVLAPQDLETTLVSENQETTKIGGDPETSNISERSAMGTESHINNSTNGALEQINDENTADSISYSPNAEISDSNCDLSQKPHEDHQSIPKLQDDVVALQDVALPDHLDVKDDGNAHIWATFSSTLSNANKRKFTKKRSFDSVSDIFSQYDTCLENKSIDEITCNKDFSNASAKGNRRKLGKKRSFGSESDIFSEYETAPENTSITIIGSREPLPKFNDSTASVNLPSLDIKLKDADSQSKCKQFEVQEGAPIFVKTKILTKKEIKECYDAQNEIILNCSNQDMERRMEVIQNLPTVEQMQQAQQVAVIRKTKEGIFCHQIEKRMKKPRRFLPPLKTTIETPKSFILSDRDVKNCGELDDTSLNKTWNNKSITSDVVSKKSSEKSTTFTSKKDEKSPKIMNSSLISKIIDKYLNSSTENNN